MKLVRYKPNPAFEEEVQLQPRFEKGMEIKTRQMAAAVRRVAPHKTGYYKRRVRAVGTRIRTLDVFWHLVEYGSVNNRPYAPLRRGLRAAGVRMIPAPKPHA